VAGCPRGSGSLRKSKEEQPQQALCTVQRCGSNKAPLPLSLSLSRLPSGEHGAKGGLELLCKGGQGVAFLGVQVAGLSHLAHSVRVIGQKGHGLCELLRLWFAQEARHLCAIPPPPPYKIHETAIRQRGKSSRTRPPAREVYTSCLMLSLGPPLLQAMTGAPAYMASTGTMPAVSRVWCQRGRCREHNYVEGRTEVLVFGRVNDRRALSQQGVSGLVGN